MTTVTLLTTHHHPHGAPLREEHRLDHMGNLMTESDRTGGMIDNLAIPNLLPWEGEIFQHLVYRMRDVFQGAEIDALIMSKLPGGHVTVILDNLTEMLRRHILLLMLDVTELALLTVSFVVQGLPFTSLLIKNVLPTKKVIINKDLR